MSIVPGRSAHQVMVRSPHQVLGRRIVTNWDDAINGEWRLYVDTVSSAVGSDIAAWTPADNNGNLSSGTVPGAGTFWNWNGQPGPWDGDTLVTLTASPTLNDFGGGNHRFLGIQKRMADGITWGDFLPGSETARVWESFETAPLTTTFKLKDIAWAANRADLGFVYDIRVLFGINESGGTGNFIESLTYDPDGPQNIHWSGGLGFIAHVDGRDEMHTGISILTGGGFDGLGTWTWDSYAGNPHPPDPPDPLPSVTVTKGGTNGWGSSVWQ